MNHLLLLLGCHYGYSILRFTRVPQKTESAGTMAVRLHEWQYPRVVKWILNIIGFEEKPTTRSHINAGVYALSPIAPHELTMVRLVICYTL